ALAAGFQQLANDRDGTPQPEPHEAPLTRTITTSTRYELHEEIGRGGIGTVFRAHDLELRREVAVKLLHESLQNRRQLLERFQEEAQITGQLQHPGIVPVYETGLLSGGRAFIA